MHISFALIATSAEARDGLLYIAGGGWEFIEAEQFPCAVTGYFAAVVEAEPEELDSLPVVKLTLADDSGQVLGSEGSTIVNLIRATTPGAPIRVPLAI